MTEKLLSNLEPGFYSSVDVSPELNIASAGEQVVALIGTGVATKSNTVVIVKGDEYVDALPAGSPGITSISRVAPVGGFAYANSAYAQAQLSADLGAGVALPATPVLSFSVAGTVVNLDLDVNNTAALIVDLINSDAGSRDLVHAVLHGTAFAIYSPVGASIIMGDTPATLALGFAAGQKANALAWNYDQEIVSQIGAAFSYAANNINNLKLKFTIEGAAAPVEYICSVGTGANLIGIPDLVADFNTYSLANDLKISAHEVTGGAFPEIAFIADDKRALMLWGAAEASAGTVYLNTRLGWPTGTIAVPAADVNSVISSRLFALDTILTVGEAGAEYQVEYLTDKVAADFAPKRITDVDGAVALYGPLVAANTLSMGAYAAFTEGAKVLLCRQLNPAFVTNGISSNGEMTAALKDLEGYDADIVVPMEPITLDTAKSVKYLQHVSKMSSLENRKERICVLGGDETSGIKDVDGWKALIAPFAPSTDTAIVTKRVVVVYPGIATVTPENDLIAMNGSYNAAAYAGRTANPVYDEATSMTRKSLTSVEGLFTPELSRTDKNALTNAGITVLERPNGITIVRRSISTDMRSIPSQEPSVTRSYDRVSQELRTSLENSYTGVSIIPNVTKASIKASAETLLDKHVALGLIGAYDALVVEPSKLDPRQFNIKFKSSPIYPLLWGNISITITI